MPPDPSRSSFYVTDDFYRTLVADFADWQRPERELSDLEIRDSVARLLYREARLLDQRQFEEWLNLYAPECAYWMPASPQAGDPRREVAIAFDDRRRLEDRVFRLRTNRAWSQVPPSRTVRVITNIEVFATDLAAIRMCRSNFSITEFRAGESRFLAGWSGHRLIHQAGEWKIQVKQVNLIDCDQNLRNPSLIF